MPRGRIRLRAAIDSPPLFRDYSEMTLPSVHNRLGPIIAIQFHLNSSGKLLIPCANFKVPEGIRLLCFFFFYYFRSSQVTACHAGTSNSNCLTELEEPLLLHFLPVLLLLWPAAAGKLWSEMLKLSA